MSQHVCIGGARQRAQQGFFLLLQYVMSLLPINGTSNQPPLGVSVVISHHLCLPERVWASSIKASARETFAVIPLNLALPAAVPLSLVP